MDLYDLLGISNPFTEIIDTFSNLSIFSNILGFILGMALAVIAYIILSYIYVLQGRKAGLNNDWFAFVPILRTSYRLDMVNESGWKILFIGGLASIIKCLLIVLLVIFAVATNAVITILFDVIVLVYLGFCAYFNYTFNKQLYKLFNFNENLALIMLGANLSGIFLLISLTGGFAVFYIFFGVCLAISSISSVFNNIFNFLTAFDNRCQTIVASASNESGYQSAPMSDRGQMECTSGMYRDAVFQIESGFEIIIGRDSYFASIVINEGANSISRKHCGVRYDELRNDYIVTDYSSNGTYIADTGERLQRNVPKHLSSGTSFYLGDKNNRFRLM